MDVRMNLDNELAEALQRGAEQARRISIEEVFEQGRKDYVRMRDEDDGEAPDVLILVLNNKRLAVANNGVTLERQAWIAGSFLNALYDDDRQG